MTLGEQQEYFAHEEWLLRQYAWELGYRIRLGEVLRPLEMQAIYVKAGRSKTMDSQHGKKLAIDYVILLEGKICTRDQIKPLGDWWEARSANHRWGGSWRGKIEAKKSSFVDAPHFELKF